MRLTKICLLTLCLTISAKAYSVDTLKIQVGLNKAVLYSLETNNKLIIFLHGGLNNPDTKAITDLDEQTVNYLIENNDDFGNAALKNGYDILIPLANDSMDWLHKPEYCHRILDSMLSRAGPYDQTVISGFSDGGTGSYKIFYSYPKSYDGLIVFNGYPQHLNFYKKVDYESITDKNIIFYSTEKDDRIPYEFLLTEYCKQKAYNGKTYFYVGKGTHSFASYSSSDMQQVFRLFAIENDSTSNAPYHGLTINGERQRWYPFRKMVVRRYAYGRDYYDQNRKQKKSLK